MHKEWIGIAEKCRGYKVSGPTEAQCPSEYLLVNNTTSSMQQREQDRDKIQSIAPNIQFSL